MDPRLWSAFLGAVTVLMLIPGPNVALLVANTVRHGLRHGLTTMAGANLANGTQAALAGLGLCTLLAQLGAWLTLLRWVGVIYLVGLGLREWRRPPLDLASVAAGDQPLGPTFRRAVVVGATNPKTLFFYGALFPQFINAGAPLGPQVAILIATLLVTAALVDTGWALLATRLRPWLTRRARLRSRITGSLMIGAGAALALTRTS
ncbi:LysE family transporter [Lichenihabitans sp. Uapishka_5]|uniref:LysE family translocator n=1 Tax=Lichenihabitans sp. Uapishka_5 TaxID=3037302 RepID=UPI0029E81309|nr:LysE family transporter [Lichenihabitans sp. Uapishka_5]MDX7950994.1 LysE family transporter [Lichenihabitans sp. Uapishka_5]